jgi:hypothetical protein
MDKPRATIREIDGQLVLDDPDALAVFQAVGKHNCKGTFEMNKERVAHFVGRIEEKGLSPADIVIVILNVDDSHGGPIADMLMPGHDWQEFRDRGETPYARGLATREGIQGILGEFDKDAAEELAGIEGVAVVVVDHMVAEVFTP